MKTYNNIFEQIYEFSNILNASYKAKKGKKQTDELSRFHFRIEENIIELSECLKTKMYKPGKYKTFFIHDPKTRMISAAPYRDRVVHHALCNIIEPIFEKTFIYDSYANRKGKGTHKAIERFQYFAKKYKYVLKCDIRRFFPSIDHAILKNEIRWKIKCKETLNLIDKIIDNSNEQEEHYVWFEGDNLFSPIERKKGLPIGNLTSQLWGNVYLNRFDHYIKEELRVKGYIRYVDDFVLFGNDKKQLHYWRANIEKYLATLRLIIHPHKTKIYKVDNGVPFLGFRLFPFYKYVKKQRSKRAYRHIRKSVKEMQEGHINPDRLESMLNSWLGHIRFGRHYYIEKKVFDYICSQGVNLAKHPRGSWRVLEQQR